MKLNGLHRPPASVGVKLKLIKFQGHEGEIEKTRSLVQENLRKKTFEDFTRLREAFEYEDLDHSGRLTLVAVYRVCQAFKIPISAARLAILLDHCTDRKKDQTDYAKFVELINWRDHPRNGQKYFPDFFLGYLKNAENPKISGFENPGDWY